MIEKFAMEPANLVAYIIYDDVTEEDVKRVRRDMNRVIDDYGSVRIYMDVRKLSGMTPQAVIEDLKLTPEYLRDVERFAIVGDKSWQEWLARLSDAITTGELRYFEPGEAVRGQTWVRRE